MPRISLSLFVAIVALSRPLPAEQLQAGAAVVNVTPTELPVIQNGGFLEAKAHRIIDPLHARALVLQSGRDRIALLVTDSCMLPRDVCDEAKKIASRESGIPENRILISATHTHSAPSAMNYCLGTRADPKYTAELPPKLARAIVDADARKVSAELGFTVADAPDHTNCRRWILRPDRIGTDPFGHRTVRAMMHPGYQNPAYIGPSGPVDTALSLVSVRALDGTPIAVFGNYSMHYFGVGGGLSADHSGAFARKIAGRIAPDHGQFVGILSQGTSGDLHWMEYSQPRRNRNVDEYTEGLVDIAEEAIGTMRYSREMPIYMFEKRITLDRRRPDATRLAWARKILPDRSKRPRNRPQVYAEQAFFIDENPTEEIVLQAIRIGDLGITGIPNEVYGLTGLEIKARSPLQPTFNIELANGAAGYIPPPEQHVLGGYTTWPARTAGLEVGAEPKIIDNLLSLLELVAREERREPTIRHGSYAQSILADKPIGYWRLEDFRGPKLRASIGAADSATVTKGVAFHLEGPESQAFSEELINRCVHLAGGHLELGELPERAATSYTVELWFWNGLGGSVGREFSGLLEVGDDVLRLVPADDDQLCRLGLGAASGSTLVPAKSWNHVALTRSREEVSVFLNGRRELVVTREAGTSRTIRVGAGEATKTSFEGKIDEVAIYARSLTPNDLARHFAISGVSSPKPPPEPAGFAEKPSTGEDHARMRKAILDAKPVAYWPLVGKDGAGEATLEEGASLADPSTPTANFSGGRLAAKVPQLGDRYSVSIWFRNDLSNTARPVTGYFFSHGADLASGAPGEHLGIGGTHSNTGRFIVFNGNARNRLRAGRTIIRPKTWNHVVLVRDGDRVRCFVNGSKTPDVDGKLGATYPREGESQVFIGGRNDRFANFEGRIEHAAIFDRPLSGEDARKIFLASGLTPIESAKAVPTPSAPKPESEPKSPEETMRATQIREGFRLELVAAEPLVKDPVAIDWGADGKLWVVEMADYPYGMDGKGKHGGRVRYLEDPDENGRYQKSTLFADGLSFPTGVIEWRKGIIVSAAPDILYLEDTDGDGRADKKDVLFTGFLPGNQQLRVNSPRWGLDNWIHFASGGHHAGYGAKNQVRSIKTGKSLQLGSRDFRILPDQGTIDPLAGPSQFGRIRNDWGDWFGVQNSFPLWHWVLEDRYTRRNPHIATPGAKQLLRGTNPRLYPAKLTQKRYHSFEHANTFTSACGPSIYRDEILFPRDGVTHAFTCDPFHSLVQHSLLERDGVTFRGRVDTKPGERDFFASADRWCRPVMTRTGPEGALYVVDMYRYMIEHPDWLPAAGREELLPFYRFGEDRGRIYRIIPDGPDAKSLREVPKIASRPSIKLVELLGHPNGSIRDRTHRVLVERNDFHTYNALWRMAEHDTRPLARMHALSAVIGAGQIDVALLENAQKDSHAGVARLAIRLSEAIGPSRVRLVSSPNRDPSVALQLALTAGGWKDESIRFRFARLAERYSRDPWIRAAVLSSVIPHQESLLKEFRDDRDRKLKPYLEPLMSLALKTNELDGLAILLESSLPRHRSDHQLSQLPSLASLIAGLESVGTTLDGLAKKNEKIAEVAKPLRAIIEAARAVPTSGRHALERQVAAIRVLGHLPMNRAEDEKILSKVLNGSPPTSVQVAAIQRLRKLGSAPSPILQLWPTLSPTVRAVAAQALLSRPDWTAAFVTAIEEGAVPRSTVAPAERQQLKTHRYPKLAERAKKLFTSGGLENREQLLAALRPAIRLNGLASRGKDVFVRRCGTCHRVDDVGNDTGPNLQALSDRSAEAYLEAIVDPNAAVEPKYVGYTAVLKTGDVVNGLVLEETGNSLNFALADGTKRHLLRSEIQTLQSTEKSFMPENIAAEMSLRDIADLLAFLRKN